MIFKRYFVEGLAHASYLFGDAGEAAVVDPKRDVDDYIADAEEAGLKIKAIFNTHPHADFASGFIELAQRTGATIYTSHLAPVTYDHAHGKEGDTVTIGGLEVQLIETPGHSPDSLSFVVRHEGRAQHVFTGDLLFVNDVGRPDLRDADADPNLLADKLYDSLFNKIFALPDDVKIHPAHGAGSLCGRAISSAPYSLVGEEKKDNWAAQLTDRGAFVEAMVSNLPDRPPYFSYDVGVNVRGASPYTDLPEVPELDESALKQLAASGAQVIDTRSGVFFGAGHFPGSLNIALNSAMFSTWVGFLVPGDTQIALVLGDRQSLNKARLELARIGFDRVVGFIEADRLTHTLQTSQMSVCDLRRTLGEVQAPELIDVRTQGERDGKHLEPSRHIPLPTLKARLNELDPERNYAVVCGSGYRSSIAVSLLQAAGVRRVQNVMGGLGAYLETQCPDMEPANLVYTQTCSLGSGQSSKSCTR